MSLSHYYDRNEVVMPTRMRAKVAAGVTVVVVAASGAEQTLGTEYTPVAPGVVHIEVAHTLHGQSDWHSVPFLLMAGQSRTVSSSAFDCPAGRILHYSTTTDEDAGPALVEFYKAVTEAPAPGRMLIVHTKGTATLCTYTGAFGSARHKEAVATPADGPAYTFDATRRFVTREGRLHRVLGVGMHPAVNTTTLVLVSAPRPALWDAD